MDKDYKEKFDWVISFMTVTDRFAFQVLAQMDKVADTRIETMGVRPLGTGIQLRYNPDYIRKLDIEELRFVLTHEVDHVVLHHITKRAPSDPREHHRHNVAADLAINCLIPDDYRQGGSSGERRWAPRWKEDYYHPVTGELLYKAGERMGCFPGDKKFPYPPELSMEQYMALLRKDQEEQQSGEDASEGGEGEEGKGQGPGEGDEDGPEGKGQGPGGGQSPGGFDNHEGWGPNEVVDEVIRQMVDRIDKSNGWGNMPAGMIEKIRAAQRPEVPWNRLLKHYLGTLVSHSKEPTFKKPARRFGYPYSGRKTSCMDRKLVAIDTSGSVGSKELEKFLAEVNNLAQIQPVDLMLFDTELLYPRAIPFDRKRAEFDFKGRGGTAFTPVFEYAVKNRYRSLIVLTDGYAEAVDRPPRMDVIWVLTPDGKCPVDWGTVVQIKTVED